MAAHDVVFPNGPDLDALQRVLVDAGVGARAVPGGVMLGEGRQAAIEAEAVVFRQYWSSDGSPDAHAHEEANALNERLQTARAVRLNGALMLDHMVRAEAGVPRAAFLAALRAFEADADALSGISPTQPGPPAPDGMDVPAVVAALAAEGIATQPAPEAGFAIAEHNDIRFLIDITQAHRAVLAAYFQPPEDGADRATRLAFANYMNGRYMLARTKFDAQDHLVVDYPLVRDGGFVPASLASTANFFSTIALRVRQVATQGWAHTPLPS